MDDQLGALNDTTIKDKQALHEFRLTVQKMYIQLLCKPGKGLSLWEQRLGNRRRQGSDSPSLEATFVSANDFTA